MDDKFSEGIAVIKEVFKKLAARAATPTNTNELKSFRFFALMPELRTKVYSEMINDSYFGYELFNFRLACRQAYNETDKLFYQLRRCDLAFFSVDCNEYGGFLSSAEACKKMQHVNVELTSEESYTDRIGAVRHDFLTNMKDEKNCLRKFKAQGIHRERCVLVGQTHEAVFELPSNIVESLQTFTDFEVVYFRGAWNEVVAANHLPRPTAPFRDFKNLLEIYLGPAKVLDLDTDIGSPCSNTGWSPRTGNYACDGTGDFSSVFLEFRPRQYRALMGDQFEEKTFENTVGEQHGMEEAETAGRNDEIVEQKGDANTRFGDGVAEDENV